MGFEKIHGAINIPFIYLFFSSLYISLFYPHDFILIFSFVVSDDSGEQLRNRILLQKIIKTFL